ncbi:MAG: hypothetical protein QXU20_01705 [Candidatus Woesearchaeota archaeon]
MLKSKNKIFKKAAAYLTIFFIVLVLVLFYLISLTAREKRPYTEELQRGYLGSYGEMLKDFTFHAFRESSTRSAYITALNCGGASNCYWVVYAQPITPELEKVKSTIKTYARSECNAYLANIKGVNFGKIVINESGTIGEINVWVDVDDITPNNNIARADESFDVSGFGKEQGILLSALDEEQRMVVHSYTITVYPLRFWYLYRIIKAWNDDAVLSKYTCQAEELVQGFGGSSCSKGPAVAEQTIDQIVELAVQDLEKRFKEKDEFVDCNYTIFCKYAKTIFICCCDENACPKPNCPDECFTDPEECAKYPDKCYKYLCDYPCDWRDPNKAYTENCNVPLVYIPEIPCVSGKCGKSNFEFKGNYKEKYIDDPDDTEVSTFPECNQPEPSCGSVEIPYQPPPLHPEDYWPTHCGEYCLAKVGNPCHGFGENHTIEFVTDIRCIDYKYQNPVGASDFKNLKFIIKAHVFLEHWVDPPPAPRCGIKVKCC